MFGCLGISMSLAMEGVEALARQDEPVQLDLSRPRWRKDSHPRFLSLEAERALGKADDLAVLRWRAGF